MRPNLILDFCKILLLIFVFTGCERDLLDNPSSPDVGEKIKVGINVGVDEIGIGNEEARSKTTKIGIDPASTKIKNLWVVQFDGIKETSKVLGVPTYIEEYIGDTTVMLVKTSENNKILYIANTFNDYIDIHPGMTLKEVCELNWEIAAESDNYHSDPNTPTDSTRYFVLNGSENKTIKDGCILGGGLEGKILKRNVAKITFTIKNTCDNLTLNSIKLKDVPNRNYYYTNRGTEDKLPEIFPIEDDIYPIDYDLHKIPSSVSGTSGTSKTYTFYVPTNKRGILNGVTRTTKPYFAPTKTTYVSVTATYVSVTATNKLVTATNKLGSTFVYSFYLGANLENDYNLISNKHYSYSIDFRDEGTPATDSRVKQVKSTDYRDRESSNCYILNPIDVERVYYIPIEERINDFWTNYSLEPLNQISSEKNKDWVAEVLWYDCLNNPIAKELVDLEKGTDKILIEKVLMPEADGKKQAFKVTLAAGFNNYGNVFVAIKRPGAANLNPGETSPDKSVSGQETIENKGTILWSWHLWITKYNPESRAHTPELKADKYQVVGGEVHRYEDGSNDPLWEIGGEYEQKFIMDRNIGARDANPHSNENERGLLYYQFGRKDPFPARAAEYTQGYGTSERPSSPTRNIPLKVDVRSGVSVARSVYNPTTFYYVNGTTGMPDYEYNWCNDTATHGKELIWADKNVLNDNKNDKSIFDPSPLGWKIPKDTAFFNFADTDIEGKNFVWSSVDHGGRYHNFAYFPATGVRYWDSGDLEVIGENAYVWSCIPNSGSTGKRLSLNLSGVHISGDENLRGRAQGQPIRSIQR